MNSLVSIGLPVFNGAPYLRRSLDSLLDQSHKNIEIIVSDNCSTDETWNILEEYKNRFPCIRAFRQESNLGACANFKFVLSQARGEFFMWAATDDTWSSNFIAACHQELTRFPRAIVALANTELFDSKMVLIKKDIFPGLINPNWMPRWILVLVLLITEFKHHFFIYGLFRRDVLQRAIDGFYNVPSGDRIFICQMAGAGAFRLSDLAAYKRMIHDIPYEERMPEEVFSRKESFRLKRMCVFVWHCMVCLWRSRVVPFHIKILSLVMFPYYFLVRCIFKMIRWLRVWKG